MLKVALFGAVVGSRSALKVLCHPTIDLTVFGLAPERRSRHADYHDLAYEARSLGIPAHAVVNINGDATLDLLRAFRPDLICVFGWSQLVRSDFLQIPRIGALGWHPSLLPKNRGRAVIPWTILQGIRTTGFTVFWIDEGVDSGDIAVQKIVSVDPRETASSLYEKMSIEAIDVVTKVRDELLMGRLPRLPQDHGKATYCSRREAADGRIDWKEGADVIDTLIRAAGEPYPGAYTSSRGRHMEVLEAAPIDGHRFWGLPGQVQWLDASGAIIRCGSGSHLLVRRIRTEGVSEQHPARVLELHERLGLPQIS